MTMNAVQGSRSWNKAFAEPSNANFTSAGATHSVTLGRRSQGDYQHRRSTGNVRFTNRVLSTSDVVTFPLDMVPDAALCVQSSPAVNLANAAQLTTQSPGTVSTLQLTTPLGAYIP